MMDSDPEACLPALMDMLNETYPDVLPTGCILGTAELKATYPTEDLRKLITSQERALGGLLPRPIRLEAAEHPPSGNAH